MLDHPLAILAVLALSIAVSEWLVRHTWLRHLGTALLVIVVVAVVANLGLIPTYSPEVPLYDGIFSHVAYVAIFLLLLQVNLRDVLRAGWPMLVLFLVGAGGTMAGVFCGMKLVGGSEAFGDLYHALGGMFVGTYTGGSINFQAIALHYDVVKEGTLYAGANAVDAGMTTVWMALSIALPRLLRGLWPRVRFAAAPPGAAGSGPLTGEAEDTESVHPIDLGWLLALGAAAVWLSGVVADWIERELGTAFPPVLILTTLALVLAQSGLARKLRGARTLGMFGVYLFLAVIGALCDVAALREIGSLGVSLSIFVAVVVLVHGAITFGAAYALRLPAEVAAVASQANIGGGTSALALARSLGRGDLVLPAILVGSLGTAIGTYLGFLTARVLV